jgi:putative DNA primase/helicase
VAERNAARRKVLPVKDRKGVVQDTHQRFYDATGKKVMPWVKGTPRDSLPLYGAEKLKDLPSGSRVFLTEGESACEALWKRGVAAVRTVIGDTGLPCDASLRVLRNFHTVRWADNDDGGRGHMEKIGERLSVLRCEYTSLEWPDAPPKGDADDYFAFGGTVEGLEALIHGSDKTPVLLGISMAEVKVEDFQWLWHQRIALGKITMFDGDGGVGKSLVTLDLAARVAPVERLAR